MKLTKAQLKQIIKEELESVLNEGTVVARGLTAWTDDYTQVEVTLDDTPIAIPEIYNQLNNMGEYEGWKNHVPEHEWEDFYTDQIASAIEDWADYNGHSYEAPDYN
jgi:hypothetical protein